MDMRQLHPAGRACIHTHTQTSNAQTEASLDACTFISDQATQSIAATANSISLSDHKNNEQVGAAGLLKHRKMLG